MAVCMSNTVRCCQFAICTCISYTETLATPTCAFDVGIVENKFTFKLVCLVVHLCSKQRQLGLGIDKHRHAYKAVSKVFFFKTWYTNTIIIFLTNLVH